MATWIEDVEHTHIGFSVRHNQISKVRGEFTKFKISLESAKADDLSGSSLVVTIAPDSVDTNSMERDNLLLGADFFNTAAHQAISFKANNFTPVLGEEVDLEGTLYILGQEFSTRITVEFNGILTDFDEVVRAGFSIRCKLNRKALGMPYNEINADGNPVVGDQVWLEAEVELMLQP